MAQARPYRRKRPREPGVALDAMTRGADAGGKNMADAQRAAFLVAAGDRKRRKRRAPPKRPAR